MQTYEEAKTTYLRTIPNLLKVISRHTKEAYQNDNHFSFQKKMSLIGISR